MTSGGVGSIPAYAALHAFEVHPVERRTCNADVAGSTPVKGFRPLSSVDRAEDFES